MLFECLAGYRPFDADTLPALCLQVTVSPPRSLPASVAPGLRDIIERCLDKDLRSRLADMGALAAALRPYAQHPIEATMIVDRTRALGSRPDHPIDSLGAHALVTRPALVTTLRGSTMSLSRPRPRRLGVPIAAAVVVVAAAMVIASVVQRGERARPDPTAALPELPEVTTLPAPMNEARIDRPGTPDPGRAMVEPAPPAPSTRPVTRPSPAQSVTRHPRPPAVRAATEDGPVIHPSPSMPAPPAPVDDPPSMSAQSAPTPGTVSLRIKTSPPGATVIRASDRVVIGTAPVTVTARRGGPPLKLRIVLAGFEPETIVLPLDRDQDEQLVLTSVRVPATETQPHVPEASTRQTRRGRGEPLSPDDLCGSDPCEE